VLGDFAAWSCLCLPFLARLARSQKIKTILVFKYATTRENYGMNDARIRLFDSVSLNICDSFSCLLRGLYVQSNPPIVKFYRENKLLLDAFGLLFYYLCIALLVVLVLWILTRIALALFSRISAKKKVKQT
jgi:hypothetical protein